MSSLNYSSVSSFVAAKLSVLRRAGALGALVAASAQLAACVAGSTDAADMEELGVAESALCPAPGTPVSFASPDVIFQNPYAGPYQFAFGIPGDFNGDGLSDAVFLDGNRAQMALFAGTGTGLAPFAGSSLGGVPQLYSPQGGTALDFDGDGDLDIAYVFQGGTSLVIALNSGAGSFTTGPVLSIPATYGMRRVAAGDFDGDGRTDLAITAIVTRTIRVVLNTPAGLSLLPAISTGNASPLDISAADLNLDGELDLVVGATSNPQPVLVYKGNGDGTFTQAASPTPKNQGINGASTYGLVVADLDADGLSDAAYVEAATHAVHAFRNTSTGASVSFANEADSGSGPYVLSDALSDIFLAPGDFDADGRPDLAVVGKVFTVGARLHVLRNAGAPGAPLAFASAGGPWLVNSSGKTSTTPRGLVVGPFNGASCGARTELAFSSSNDTVSDWSVQYVRNTTE